MPIFQKNSIKKNQQQNQEATQDFLIPLTPCLSEPEPVVLRWEQAASSPQDSSQEQLRKTSHVWALGPQLLPWNEVL